MVNLLFSVYILDLYSLKQEINLHFHHLCLNITFFLINKIAIFEYIMNFVSASTQYCSVLHHGRGWGLGMFLDEWSDWWFSAASISSVWSLSGTSLQCEYDLWRKIVKCLAWQVFITLESWITHIQFDYFPEVLMIYVDNGSLYWLPAIKKLLYMYLHVCVFDT